MSAPKIDAISGPGAINASTLGGEAVTLTGQNFGGNDFLRKLDKNATFDQLRQMIRAIQQTGALVILISVDFPLGGSWTRMYRELAQETGCPHVPDQLGGIFGHRDLMSDEVHPNAKGYAIMAEKIEPVLRNYLD